MASSAASERTAQDVPVAILAAALVAVWVGWTLNLPQRLGLVVFTEQALALAAAIAFAGGVLLAAKSESRALRVAAYALAAAVLAALAYVAAFYPELSIRAAMRPPGLIAVAGVIVAVLLLLVWRLIGVALVLVIALFIGAALFGAVVGIPETTPARLPLYLLIDPNALLGLPLKVAVEVVVPFILFGELLRVSGGGEYLTRLALAVFGRYRGGGAKAAIGASAVFGTVSGNAVSNVVGTGVVTIPLIKRTGFSAAQAGAVEAVASTGGQLLPPVMGAAAFVMADFLRVPYTDVLVAALLPAILYFAAVFIQVDRIAARRGIRPLERREIPALAASVRSGWQFFLPFAAMFVVLFRYETRPQYAAIAAAAVLIAVSIAIPFEGRRISARGLVEAVIATGRSCIALLVITAGAGLIIGLISVTGLGFSLAVDAVAASGGSALALLALVAVCAIVFGMGMPTVAVYVVLATILAPALTQVGLGEMQAHLFIFYFGMMSMLTPPVALASITAARIAEADPWATSLAAVRLGWVAYIVPFLFAFSPALLLVGDPLTIGLAAGTAFAGIYAVSSAFAGFARRPLSMLRRLLLLAAGAALMLPPAWHPAVAAANLVGAVVLAALLVDWSELAALRAHAASFRFSRHKEVKSP